MSRSLWKGPVVDENLVRAVQFIAKKNLSLTQSVPKENEFASSKKINLPLAIQPLLKKEVAQAPRNGVSQSKSKTSSEFASSPNVRYKIRTWARYSTILPEWVGQVFDVYNGKTFIQVLVNSNMVGHKLGSYALTRKLPKHPSAKNTKGGKALALKKK